MAILKAVSMNALARPGLKIMNTVTIAPGFIINLDEPDSLVAKRWRARIWMRMNPFAHAMRCKMFAQTAKRKLTARSDVSFQKRAIIAGKLP